MICNLIFIIKFYCFFKEFFYLFFKIKFLPQEGERGREVSGRLGGREVSGGVVGGRLFKQLI